MVEDPIRWLLNLERFGIKLGLDSMRALLRALAHPESGYPSVLIGGTNGKGSVAALLDALLLAAGQRPGLTTSPHLVRLNERIRIAGDDISTQALRRQLAHVRNHLDDALAAGLLPAHPSFFEVMIAAAFCAFRAAEVDVALLEVGLGGRLDATNVADAVVSVIVTIDLDHTDRLGTTIERIATEKAGIVKSGRPLVSGVTQPEARRVLREVCSRSGSRFLEVHDGCLVVEEGKGRFTLETQRARYPDLVPALRGAHQVHNTRVAILALETLSNELGLVLSPEAVRAAVARVRWPGRLQWIEGAPSLLLDGAHNPAGARALAEHLRAQGGPRPVLLFGAMDDKDVPAMLGPLALLARRIVLTRPPNERAADPAALATALPPESLEPVVTSDAEKGLEQARALAGPEGLVVVAGSLYLVGEVLRLLEERRSG